MRRALPLLAVFSAAALLFAGVGSAMTADTPPLPVVSDTPTTGKDAPSTGGQPYWVEVGAKRCQ